MQIKFYGTRGSIPVCERDFQEFGGNTTCVQVTFDSGDIVIFDAGSGIRNLGKDLVENDHQQFENIHICFSHFHWDHIQGFPFFSPAYNSKRSFTLSAIGKERKLHNLKSIFQVPMQQEYFPVALDKMGATFHFHQSDEDTIIENNAMISVQKHNHPGGAYSYKIDDGRKTMVFSTDIEHGNRIDPKIVEFAKDADILIHDAQFTPEELNEKKGWGHSSYEQALTVAEQANVSLLIMTHHDPDHNDAFLTKIEKKCQERFKNCILAREKEVF